MNDNHPDLFKKQPKTNVYLNFCRLLTIILILCLITNFWFIRQSSLYQKKYEKINSQYVNLEQNSLSKTSTEDQKPTIKQIAQKEIQGGRMVAYQLDYQWLKNVNSTDFYALVSEVGDNWSVVFSPFNFGLGSNEIFAIIDKDVWLINSQTNTIDVYQYFLSQIGNRNGTPIYSSSLSYKQSISLPQKKIGQISQLTCDSDYCLVRTSRSMDSGCSMKIDIKTFKYSNLECISR